MKLELLVQTSADVAATPGRLEKIAKLAALFAQAAPDEIAVAIGFLTGWPRQGKLGVGWAQVSDARDHPPATEATLQLLDVDARFDELKTVRGKNSASERARIVGELFSRATSAEQQFLAGMIVGEVRQGALEGVLLEAIAKAANLPAASLRRAVMMAGDLGAVAQAVLSGGGEGVLAQYSLELFRPVQPMLADSAETVEDALKEADGAVAIEWKLDGARIQVHRRGDRVAVYTRNLNDVTARVPEVVDAVRALPAHELILDGEVIALSPEGKPYSFQTTMRRFGRRLDVDALRAELPLTPVFFDVLFHDGESVIDAPLSERIQRLDRIVPTAS